MKVSAKLNTLRKRIAELTEEIEWLGSAPLPRNEVVARLDRYIDSLAGRWSPKFDVFGPDADPREVGLFTFKARLDGRVESGVVIGSSGVDLAPALAALMPDTLKAFLRTYVEQADYEPGPPAAERPDIVRKLKAERLQLEIEEEQSIVLAEEAGMMIWRRDDCDPAVVLGWKDEQEAA